MGAKSFVRSLTVDVPRIPCATTGRPASPRHRSHSPIDAGRTSTRPGKSNRTWNPQRNLPTRRPVNSSKPFGRRLKAVKVAGFDGVEVHGANGYLIDQFLCETSNKRETGRYAGTTLETRSQFLKDVLANVTEEVGSDRVGLRISP